MNILLITLMMACKVPDTATPMVITPPASTTTPVATTPVAPKLVWADEFDTPGLPDPAKWGYDVGGNGWGNNELEYYTDKRPENARVEAGKLIIEARKEDYKGSKYTSARLLTKDKQMWKYGRIEARAKLPKGVGTWPAIWMLGEKVAKVGWPLGGEIDIMEHVGFDEGVVHGTVHTEAYNHVKGTQKGGDTKVADVTTEFHVYAVEWTDQKIAFFVDNNQYYAVERSVLGGTEDKWPFDQPYFLLLNLAVGGGWGGQKGVDDSIWPQRMEVDYVRVYQ